MNGEEWGRTNSTFGRKEVMMQSMNKEVKMSRI
jgi:hypothetical protein